jgi:integrase
MRTVILLEPLAADLADWRAACGHPPDNAFVFSRPDGAPWNEDDWRNWRKRQFAAAADAAEIEIVRPYDLRHSAASLWLQEGVNPVQVAAWIGNRPSMTTDTYAHVIAEFDPAERKPAADVIWTARQDIAGT